MSANSMKDFLAELERDNTFRSGLNNRIAGVSDDGVADQVIAYAGEHGYTLSHADLEQLQRIVHTVAANDEELSDEALNDVSGGIVGFGQLVAGVVDQTKDGVWDQKFGPGDKHQFKNAINPFKKDFWTLKANI